MSKPDPSDAAYQAAKLLYLEALQKCADAFTAVMKMPPCPEKEEAAKRVTEAGMWVRMGLEMSIPPEIRAEVKAKPCPDGCTLHEHDENRIPIRQVAQ